VTARRIATLPNALTAARLVLAPVFLVLYARGDTVRALAAFAVAAATDVLDGLAARVLGQHSRLGAVLDPVADKVLAACALFALTARHRLPLWFPLFVVSRDLAQLLGAGALRVLGRRLPSGPTRVSKYATFMLAAVVVVALAWELLGWPPGEVTPVVGALGLLAAECVAVSWAQYFLFFLRALRQPAEAG
jgi:cardiolipin synthase